MSSRLFSIGTPLTPAILRRMIGAGADDEEEQMPTRRETLILFALGLLSGTALGLPLWPFPPALVTGPAIGVPVARTVSSTLAARYPKIRRLRRNRHPCQRL